MGWGRDPRGSPVAPQTFVSLAFSAEQKLWSGGEALVGSPRPTAPLRCLFVPLSSVSSLPARAAGATAQADGRAMAWPVCRGVTLLN